MKSKEKKDVASVAIVAIIAIVAIVGIFFYLASAKPAEEANVGQAYSAAAKASDPGKIWETLQSKGLQGTHYTLNIHGKDSTFNKQDCAVTPDPVTGQYSNNIFVPSNSDSSVNNQIIITSGNAKGKYASTSPIYGVRDACTAPFDGTAASLVLPPNEKGYYVVARVLGKPTNNPEIALEGDLMWVQDESGNDLLVLGLVTDSGFATPTTTLARTKGNVKAVDITGLFEWSGSVCYFNPTNYCYDALGQFICTTQNICCQDTNADGILDTCVAPLLDSSGAEYCDTGYALMTMSCRDYTNEWVFNIGDFVGYMWEAYTNGDFKLVNIRFYPVV